MSATPSAIKSFTVDFSWQAKFKQNYTIFLCVNGQRRVRLSSNLVPPKLPKSCALNMRLESLATELEISSDKKNLRIMHPLASGALSIEVVETSREQGATARSSTFFSRSRNVTLDTAQFEPGKHHQVLIRESGFKIFAQTQCVGDAVLIFRSLEDIDSLIGAATEMNTCILLFMFECIAQNIQIHAPEALENLMANVCESFKQIGIIERIKHENLQMLDALRMDRGAFMAYFVNHIGGETAQEWIAAAISKTLPEKSPKEIMQASADIVQSIQHPEKAPEPTDEVRSGFTL